MRKILSTTPAATRIDTLLNFSLSLKKKERGTWTLITTYLSI